MLFEVPRYDAEIASRPALVKTPDTWSNLTVFRSDLPGDDMNIVFQASNIGKRFNEKIAPHLNAELAGRTEILFSSVLGLRDWRLSQGETGLQVPDADLIQGWVLQQIQPPEFPQLVPPAFTDWAERLAGNRVPHIAQANRWIAERVAGHFTEYRYHAVDAADLGAGTGSTMLSLAEQFDSQDINANIIGVDLTPFLIQIAREKTGRTIVEGNALEWLEKQEKGTLDLITMVYAIHHLSYEDQVKLQKLAFSVLKDGGVLAIADPTGRSKFNLENLDVNEPEAVIACFNPSVAVVAEKLAEIGFTVPQDGNEQKIIKYDESDVESTQIGGGILDQGTLGYALIVIKE
ncbi:class I SAM-dependent methyltransferase [Candidatus Roizmanbacteria bacterium]|nr:class I SAM-dependent methyltransferase [Candidatus Roizmanbacteria bacterium]